MQRTRSRSRSLWSIRFHPNSALLLHARGQNCSRSFPINFWTFLIHFRGKLFSCRSWKKIERCIKSCLLQYYYQILLPSTSRHKKLMSDKARNITHGHLNLIKKSMHYSIGYSKVGQSKLGISFGADKQKECYFFLFSTSLE